MSCPIWDLPEFDRSHWDLDYLCWFVDCPTCTAEPGEVPWIPDAPDRADPEARQEK